MTICYSLLRRLTGLLLCLCSLQTLAAAEDEVRAAVDAWKTSVHTHDTAALIALYAPDAVLYTAFDSKVVRGVDELRAYFDGEFRKDPLKLELVTSKQQVFNDQAALLGEYVIEYRNKRTVKGHYTFVYRKIGGKWLIEMQHASENP